VLAVAVAAAAQAYTTRMAVSPNWSGYVAQSPAGKKIAYTSATGTWTVPKATCRPNRRTFSTA
jgi:hypothetical protein